MNVADLKANNPTPPRASAIVLEQLTDLRRCLGAMEDFGAQDFATAMSLKSAHGEVAALERELAAARLLESTDDAELKIAGAAVHDNAIFASTLGAILHKFQSLITALLQGSTGPATLQGRVPAEVVSDSRLLVASTFSGSFGLRLRRHHPEVATRLYPAAEVDVLEIAQQLLDPGEAGEQVATAYCAENARVFAHYRDLLELMSNNRVDVRVATRANPYDVALDAEMAGRRRLWLLTQASEDKTLDLVGIIVGTSLVTDRFELQVGDDVLKGTAEDSACKDVSRLNLFGKRVRAKVRQTIERHAHQLKEPTTRYHLLGVESFELPRTPNLFTGQLGEDDPD